jgi:hypothetical protein
MLIIPFETVLNAQRNYLCSYNSSYGFANQRIGSEDIIVCMCGIFGLVLVDENASVAQVPR